MMFSRLFRRSAALAATAAIALQAFWPLIAQARPAGVVLPVTICGIDGVKHGLEIRIGKTTPLEERSASHGEHCKLCALGDGNGVAVVALDISFVVQQGSSSKPLATPAASFHRATPIPAQPRAPPASV